MPRVATTSRPQVGSTQGARRADVHRVFQHMIDKSANTSNITMGGGRGGPPTGYGPNGKLPVLPQGNWRVPQVKRVVEYVDEWRVPQTLEYVRKLAPMFRLIDFADSVDRLTKVEGNAYYKTFTAWPSNATPFKTVYCPQYLSAPTYDGSAGSHMAVFNGDVTSTICQTGQSWPGNVEIETGAGIPTGLTVNMTAGTRSIVIGPENKTIAGRFKNSIIHVVTVPASTTGARVSHMGYTTDWMQNPNITRRLPSELTMYQLGYGTPVPPSPGLEPTSSTNGGRYYASRSFMRNDNARGGMTVRTSRIHERKPPRKREKQSKLITKAERLGKAIFKWLDVVSEYSELVDAFFDALPDDVKDRWSDRREKRGLLDTAGQYGIDGSDWKIQAVWHNWHKLDTADVLRNIVSNEYQDKVLGLIHRNTPVNTGQATSGAMKEVNKEIEAFLKTLGF